jgi:hypothetical protein
MADNLHFRTDGTFTIVQFTDMHFKNGEPEDEQTSALMAEVLDAEQLDLVALTGDVIDGGHSDDPAASWQRAVAPIVDRSLPWAAVFGNHDDEGALSRQDLMAVQQSIPHCLTSPGPTGVSGVGNYVLPVKASQTDEAAATLYFVDSNAYAETNIAGYGWIRRDQIAWFLDEAKRQRPAVGAEPLPALAFFHIPLPEYNQIWDLQVCYGDKYEPVCCALINTGFFAALHEAGDVVGVFVGHDHVNDFEGELYGIRLCYGRGSGFNTYGREGFKRGARVIQLREGRREFQSWLRLEGGDVVHEQAPHQPELRRKTCIL